MVDAGPASENLALRRLIAVYRRLSSLAVQNAGVSAVTQLIAEHTCATVATVSPAMDILAAAAPGESSEQAAQYVRDLVIHPRLGEVLNAAGRARRALRLPDLTAAAAVIVAPVLVGDDVPAYLLTLDGDHRDGEDTSLLLTEHAATICGVILGRERVVSAAAGRVRDDLVEGLLSGRAQDDAEVARWARHLGYDPQRDHHVCSVAIEPPGPGAAATAQRATAAAEHFLTTRAPRAIISVRGAEVAAVLPEPAAHEPCPKAAPLAQMCVRRLAELFPDVVVTIGIGGRCRDPADIARSYAQARRTVDTLRRMGRAGRVEAFEDLGIHRLLLQVPSLAELRGFAREVLGPLLSDERDQAGAFLTTLACYFRENNSPQRAAQALHVHPNTVTYRIRRAEEITGLDFSGYRDRLMAQVALEILDAVGDGR